MHRYGCGNIVGITFGFGFGGCVPPLIKGFPLGRNKTGGGIFNGIRETVLLGLGGIRQKVTFRVCTHTSKRLNPRAGRWRQEQQPNAHKVIRYSSQTVVGSDTRQCTVIIKNFAILTGINSNITLHSDCAIKVSVSFTFIHSNSYGNTQLAFHASNGTGNGGIGF